MPDQPECRRHRTAAAASVAVQQHPATPLQRVGDGLQRLHTLVVAVLLPADVPSQVCGIGLCEAPIFMLLYNTIIFIGIYDKCEIDAICDL